MLNLVGRTTVPFPQLRLGEAETTWCQNWPMNQIRRFSGPNTDGENKKEKHPNCHAQMRESVKVNIYKALTPLWICVSQYPTRVDVWHFMTLIRYVSDNSDRCANFFFFPLVWHFLDRCPTLIRHSYNTCRMPQKNYYFSLLLQTYLQRLKMCLK
jgi:hypothetical protein